MKTLPALAASLIIASAPAFAQLNVKFVESAPKDWFAVTNASDCAVDSMSMDIDLSGSAGKLIFDTTATGAGVEVFQPFEARSGNIELTSSSKVNDGDKRLSVLISDLQPGETASFTIDVDDTLTNSELGMIRVSRSEISGSGIQITVNGEMVSGELNNKGELRLDSGFCA